ncbi:hypothetical protein NESM_000563000 [Novymonas esmeraldas]|uniref:Uncharacterized protein n=1 Tax=Novymonas esmeraldas TaxID=1808958 RepID=A0AAW0ESN7_9TRYP
MSRAGTTRLFLVRCEGRSQSFGDGTDPPRQPPPCEAAEDVAFLELPRIPVTTPPSTDSSGTGGDALASRRPLVSPAVQLGRQTPFLSAALRNDRAWSRSLLEVTTWCIQGLPCAAAAASDDGALPVEAASLPFAGVRVRLCGGGHPIRIVRGGATTERGSATVMKRGSCAWLQHGDVLEFGSHARVRLLAVHTRVGVAEELAGRASFVWVASAVNGPRASVAPSDCVTDGGAPARPATVVTALWSARFSEWAATPKYLKAKMLREAVQMTVYRPASTVAASAVEADRGKRRAAAPSAEDERCPQEEGEEVLALASPRQDSEARHSASAAAGDMEVDAATPTTESQRRPRSTPAGLDHPFAAAGAMASRHESRQSAEAVTAADLPSPSQRRSSSAEGGRRRTAPPALRASGLHRPSGASALLSGATLSDTMDERLNEALLHLENGGVEVGDALVQRRDQALVLGAVEEEDLSGTRAASSDNVLASASQRSGWDASEEDGRHGEASAQRHRRSTKRGRDTSARDGRAPHLGGRRARRDTDEGAHDASRGPRVSTSDAAGLSQWSLDKTARLPAVPQLTRADIRRPNANQNQPEEDSQVVFFDQ